ncbi:uncharacterized protein LOC143039136 [Oratosquilla oratoria]|uniref:uncharacterized protein LOC143039136 n=1 Tax=Oratosquilla oratoria TaxID=337810 RepID=UPI003F76195F
MCQVFVHLSPTRVRSHLLKFQRPEQFQKGFLAAHVDLKMAFDLAQRGMLWDLLRIRGILARIINLISGLYFGTESAVKYGGSLSGFFPVNSGVKHGCALGPTLSNPCMDFVLDSLVDQSRFGTSFINIEVSDLSFAFAESLEVLVVALRSLHRKSRPLRLEVS